MVHELSPAEARRIAVRAQLLDAARPTSLLETVRHLTLLQIDPTAAVAPSADLVAWSRLGGTYEHGELVRALEAERTLFEYDATIRPADDLPIFRAVMAASPRHGGPRAWLEANDAFRRDLLERLRADGPLAGRELPDTAVVPWKSTGWTHERNVTQMLELLALRGEIAVSRRAGRERLWDLAERVLPASPALDPEEAERVRDERRLAALGIARARGTRLPIEQVTVGSAGEAAVVAGVAGEWRVDPAQLARLDEPFAGRAALLSPFDRLVYDRKRALELFGFEYTLEMYKPAAKRRWGYFALPILVGDRLVGKLDAVADRKAGRFLVHAVHEDEPFDVDTRAAVDAELDALAAWLGLGLAR